MKNYMLLKKENEELYLIGLGSEAELHDVMKAEYTRAAKGLMIGELRKSYAFLSQVPNNTKSPELVWSIIEAPDINGSRAGRDIYILSGIDTSIKPVNTLFEIAVEKMYHEALKYGKEPRYDMNKGKLYVKDDNDLETVMMVY